MATRKKNKKIKITTVPMAAVFEARENLKLAKTALPFGLNMEAEYAKIQAKTSNLTGAQRRLICKLVADVAAKQVAEAEEKVEVEEVKKEKLAIKVKEQQPAAYTHVFKNYRNPGALSVGIVND